MYWTSLIFCLFLFSLVLGLFQGSLPWCRWSLISFRRVLRSCVVACRVCTVCVPTMCSGSMRREFSVRSFLVVRFLFFISFCLVVFWCDYCFKLDLRRLWSWSYKLCYIFSLHLFVCRFIESSSGWWVYPTLLLTDCPHSGEQPFPFW